MAGGDTAHSLTQCVQLGELGAGSQLASMADELTSALVAQSTDPDTVAVDAAHMAPAMLALALSQGSVLGSLAAARTLSTLPEDTLQVHALTTSQHTIAECIAWFSQSYDSRCCVFSHRCDLLVQVTEVHTQLQHSIGQLASVLQPDSVIVGRKEGKLEIWRSSAAAVGSVDAKRTSVRSCPSLRRGTYEYFEVQRWQRTMHYHLLPMLNSYHMFMMCH